MKWRGAVARADAARKGEIFVIASPISISRSRWFREDAPRCFSLSLQGLDGSGGGRGTPGGSKTIRRALPPARPGNAAREWRREPQICENNCTAASVRRESKTGNSRGAGAHLRRRRRSGRLQHLAVLRFALRCQSKARVGCACAAEHEVGHEAPDFRAVLEAVA